MNVHKVLAEIRELTLELDSRKNFILDDEPNLKMSLVHLKAVAMRVWNRERKKKEAREK